MQIFINYKRCEKLQGIAATLGEQREERDEAVQEHTATGIRLWSPIQLLSSPVRGLGTLPMIFSSLYHYLLNSIGPLELEDFS